MFISNFRDVRTAGLFPSVHGDQFTDASDEGACGGWLASESMPIKAASCSVGVKIGTAPPPSALRVGPVASLCVGASDGVSERTIGDGVSAPELPPVASPVALSACPSLRRTRTLALPSTSTSVSSPSERPRFTALFPLRNSASSNASSNPSGTWNPSGKSAASSSAKYVAARAAAAVAVGEGWLQAMAKEVKNSQRHFGALEGLKTCSPEEGQTRMPASKSACILDQSALREGCRRRSLRIVGDSDLAT